MNKDFLLKLQEEAKFQKKLNEKRIFPVFFDDITSFIGVYSWQTLIFLSIMTVILARFFKN